MGRDTRAGIWGASSYTELIALIDLIYEAALDNDLWPGVLINLADAMGAAQVAMPSMDLRANVVATIAPRCDPDLLTSWKEYWANPFQADQDSPVKCGANRCSSLSASRMFTAEPSPQGNSAASASRPAPCAQGQGAGGNGQGDRRGHHRPRHRRPGCEPHRPPLPLPLSKAWPRAG